MATNHTASLIEPDKAHPATKVQILRCRLFAVLIEASAIGLDETLDRLRSRGHPALRILYFSIILVLFVFAVLSMVICIAERGLPAVTGRVAIHRTRMIHHQHSRGGAGRRGRCCLFQLDFERDIVLVRDNLTVLICCGFSCLTDGLHTRNTGAIICAGTILSFSPLAILANRTIFHVVTRIRQHVQRQ